jgi:hypothetical protein
VNTIVAPAIVEPEDALRVRSRNGIGWEWGTVLRGPGTVPADQYRFLPPEPLLSKRPGFGRLPGRR